MIARKNYVLFEYCSYCGILHSTVLPYLSRGYIHAELFYWYGDKNVSYHLWNVKIFKNLQKSHLMALKRFQDKQIKHEIGACVSGTHLENAINITASHNESASSSFASTQNLHHLSRVPIIILGLERR